MINAMPSSGRDIVIGIGVILVFGLVVALSVLIHRHFG